MKQGQKRIRLRKPQVEDRLPDDLSPLLRRVYLNRGVGDAGQLDLSLKHLHSYHELKGIEAAAALLADAIAAQKHILIVGDFDADGATSTALAMTALGRFGARQVSYLVPDRFRFGYGLTPEIVALARERDPDLIITVDNGISSIQGVRAAKQAGMQVLITDHHLPGAELPEADVIVNPNQPGCGFPSKNLAGVGVIFYVMAALRAELRSRGQLSDDVVLSDLLDLVALGTVADVVPLDYNNRILVAQGLGRMRKGMLRPGIQALARVAGRDVKNLSSMDLGFFVGPRLNAAGRLEDMSIGIECLLSDSDDNALSVAQRLHDLNAQRRELQTQMQEEAEALIERGLKVDAMPHSLCVFDDQWHEGIVGLVASKLKERYHRPSIAFAPAGEPGMLKGSARSIPGLHIRDALDTVAALHPELINKFGGHAMAAGLSLAANKFEDFSLAFEQAVSQMLDDDDLDAVIDSDGELRPEEFALPHAEALSEAGPWGQHFPQPVFHGRFDIEQSRVVGDRHLKLNVCPQGTEQSIDAIAFGAGHRKDSLGRSAVMAYRLEVNEYLGNRKPQLVVEHIAGE